jgi:hypothetical protein
MIYLVASNHKNKYTKPLLFHLIEKFIIENKLICYGGMAINNIIPEKTERFYDEIDIPDYDCFSPNAIKDSKILSQLLITKYENIEVKSAMFKGTYKIFVNFIPIADITYLHHNIFDALLKDSITVAGIKYASPNFLRMSMYLELSRPAGDVSRWEKVLKRLTLLNKYHPLDTIKKCNPVDFQKKLKTILLY